MKILLAMVAVAWSGVASAQAPNLQSGDVVQIGDFQYVVMTKFDFDRCVLMIDEMKHKWDKVNSTEVGRSALHGKRGHATITNGVIQTEYEDGYIHCESIQSNRISRMEVPIKHEKKPEAVKSAFELRREEIRKRRQERLSQKKEVSVTIER